MIIFFLYDDILLIFFLYDDILPHYIVEFFLYSSYMSHISLSHVTHMTEPCHAYD